MTARNVQSLVKAHGTKTKRQLVIAGFATLTMAFGLAACSGSAGPTKSNNGGSVATTPTTQCVIPQNNGGDHDADNNGAPSDGDGCDV